MPCLIIYIFNEVKQRILFYSNVVTAICWHEKHPDLLRGMHSPLVAFSLTFRSFSLSLTVFVPMICLNDVFLLKAMTGVALNAFPNVLLTFNICQCLSLTSLIFSKVGLHATENGIMFFRTESVLFNRVDLSKLSTFLVWLRMMLSLYPFPVNPLTKSLECFCVLQKLSKHSLLLML